MPTPPRKTHHEEEEEPAGHERWLITYADMITLLMVLFVVLFAIGQTDLAKYSKLKAGLADGFHGDAAPGDPESMLAGGSEPDAARPIAAAKETAADAQVALDEKLAHEVALAQERAALEQTAAQIKANFEALGLGDRVELRVELRGLVVAIVTDRVLFDSGSASLRSDGRDVLGALGPTLAALPNGIAIEGHTDDVAMKAKPNAKFQDNTAPATRPRSGALRRACKLK